MEDIEIEEGEACINQDNDEKIDPDIDFAYLDKKVQDVLGHYQKDFMGEISAENLGAKWGGYGSFLCEASNSPLSSHSRSQTQTTARPKPSHYTTSEGPCLRATSQANIPLPAKSEPALTGSGVQSLPAPVTSSSHGLARAHRYQHLDARSSTPTKVCLEGGSGKFVTSDMSELYSCLGLIMSPSPTSSSGDPPAESVQSPVGMDEMLGKSPSIIVKAMTSFPVPGDLLLSPLADELLSLRRKEVNTASMVSKKNEKDNSDPGQVASVKKDFDSISAKKRVGLTEAKKIKQRDENGKLEKKVHTDSVKSLGIGLKRKEDGGQSKERETIRKYSPRANGVSMLSIGEDASNKMVKDSGVSRNRPKNQPNRLEDTSVEQLASLTSKKQTVKGKSSTSMEIISVTKEDNRGDESGGMLEPKVTNKLSRQVKYTVKDSFPVSLSSQEDGVPDRRKINLKVKKVCKENPANPHGGKGDLNKEKHGDEKHDSSQRLKAHSSRGKSGSDFSNSKDCSSADGKKKLMKKDKSNSQSNTVLPKVSFKVGSSSLGTGSSYSGKMDDVASQKDLKKLDKGYTNSARVSISKEKKTATSVKGPVLDVPKGEKHVFSIKSNSKLHNKEPSGSSTVRSSQAEDANGSILLTENGFTSHGHAEVLPPAPMLISEHWIECEKCLKWRLLPLNLMPDDLPDKWHCTLLSWLPGMNDCSISETQTTEAVRALCQPVPPIPPIPPLMETMNGQKAPHTVGEASNIATFDASNVGTCNQVAESKGVHTSGDMRQYQDQRKALEIRSIKKMKQPTSMQSNCAERISDTGTVLTGKKRPSLNDVGTVHKQPKRRHRDVMESNNMVTADIRRTEADCHSKDHVVSNTSATASKKLRETNQKPSSTGAQETNVLVKKRCRKDLDNDEPKRAKKLKMSVRYESQEKESGRIQEKDCAHSGSNSRKDGNRDGKSLLGKCKRNSLSTKLDMESRIPDPASISSSSLISSKLKGKMDKVRCSPLGSFSSSPLKVERSNHDRTRNFEESSLIKKTPKIDDGLCDTKRRDSKAKSAKDPDCLKSKQVYRVDGADKISSRKPVDGGTWENELKLEVHEIARKETQLLHKEPNVSSKDHTVCALDGLNENKNNNDNVGPKAKKADCVNQAGRVEDRPSSSSSQFVDCQAGDGTNSGPLHGGDVRFPKLVTEDLGPSGSGKKDGVDWAAATALKEAKRLKHSANRMRSSGSGLSTLVFFEAALKFLHGASLMETGDSEMKPMEVYCTTAELCQYCAREFEKSNDLASAALAYKCMETAYMRVLYCCTAVTGRDVQVLRTAERAIPQAASPSSSASDVDNVNNAPASEAASSSASRGNIVIPAGDQPIYLRTLKIIDYAHLAMDAARKSIGTFEAACPALEEAGKAESVASLRRAIDFSFNNIDELLHIVRLAMEAVSG